MRENLQAVLVLFDPDELPVTRAESALAIRSLKGVWHTELLAADAVADVAKIRQDTGAWLRLQDIARAGREADAERLREAGAL